MDENLKNEISKIINEQYASDIKLSLFGRSCCKYTGDITETLAHLLMGFSSLTAFAAGSWPNYTYLSFIAGSLGVTSLVLLKFSSYAMSESKERTLIANKILDKLKLEQIVDISFNSTNQDLKSLDVSTSILHSDKNAI